MTRRFARWCMLTLALGAGACHAGDGVVAPCTSLNATRVDTSYFLNIAPPRISAIVYECAR